MTKEKKAPQAYKKKEAQHPGSNTRLIEILEHVPDPRGPSCNFKHPLTTVLFITIVCSLCGANDWEIIVVQAQAMKDWLSRYIDLSQGIPCVRTFKRVFEAICPDKMETIIKQFSYQSITLLKLLNELDELSIINYLFNRSLKIRIFTLRNQPAGVPRQLLRKENICFDHFFFF